MEYYPEVKRNKIGFLVDEPTRVYHTEWSKSEREK